VSSFDCAFALKKIEHVISTIREIVKFVFINRLLNRFGIITYCTENYFRTEWKIFSIAINQYLRGSIFKGTALYRQRNQLAETIHIEDIDLAKLCARGDDKARHELYTRYAAYLFALCIRYVGDRELARDLMHDGMIKIFDTIGKYKPTGSLKSWCARVTVNLVIDHLRKSRRVETVSIDQTQEKIPEPQNEEIAKIPKTELMRMVGELPETKRVIFNLFCVEGYSHKDIAQMLDIKEKTSSSLLFKARAQLAENVRDYIRSNGL
jgi:RNA polymerase sigma-70 factor (ECF subfamily)